MDDDSTNPTVEQADDESSSAPPWLAQLQQQLQQQLQWQQEHHQRDIELLRRELQEHWSAAPTPEKKSTPAAMEPGVLAQHGAVETGAPAAKRPSTTATELGALADRSAVEPGTPAAEAPSTVPIEPGVLAERSAVEPVTPAAEALSASHRSTPTPSSAGGPAASPAPTSLQRDGTVRRPPVAAPVKLSSSATLREFHLWRASWNDYYRIGNIYTLSQPDQLAYLRACFTEDMRAASLHAVGMCPHSDDVDSSLDKIERYLRLQHNVAIDRVKFEERQQEEGESFDSFLIVIKELAADAELCPSCLDDRVSTQIMSGIRDKETRRKLLALRPIPTLVQSAALETQHLKFGQ